MQFPARARYAPRACRCFTRIEDDGVALFSDFASFFGGVAPITSGDRLIPAKTVTAATMKAIFIAPRSFEQYSRNAAPSREATYPRALHFPAQAGRPATPQPRLSPRSSTAGQCRTCNCVLAPASVRRSSKRRIERRYTREEVPGVRE